MKKTKSAVPKKRGEIRSFSDTVSSGLILPFLSRAALFLHTGVKNSAVGRFFRSYDRTEELRKASLHTLPLDRLNIMGNVIRPLRFSAAKQFDNSRILQTLSSVGVHLAGLPLSEYGLLFLFFSLCSSGIFAFRYLSGTIPDGSLGDLGVSVIFLLTGILLVASRRHFSEALLQSKIVGPLLFRFLGVRESTFRNIPLSRGHFIPAALMGTVLGLLTFFFPPELFVAAIGILITAVLILKTPEAGIVLGILILPFASQLLPHPTILLVGYSLFVFFSFFLKLLRGKRIIRFEFLDFCVLLFMLVLLAGGLFSADPAGSIRSAAVFLCFLCWYFLTVNCIRSEVWLDRAVTAMLVSSTVVGIWGILQYLSGSVSTVWQDIGMFGDIEGRAVSTFENPNVLGEYLILCFPSALASLMSAKSASSRLRAFFCCLSVGLCLILTWSRGAWLGLLCALLLYFLIYSPKTLAALLFVILALPFLPLVLPDSVTNRFLSIGNLADTSTSYRVHIWEGVLRMVKDHAAAGIGIGEGAFSRVYPLYALSGIETAPHSHNLYLQILVECGIFGLLVFLIFLLTYTRFSFTRLSDGMPTDRHKYRFAGLFCGTAAVLIQGMTDYVWYNYRIFLMLWITIGLTAALGRIVHRERKDPEDDPYSDADNE